MTPLVTLDGDSELDFTDIFCGAGGSSIGLTEAGLELKLAANHWDRAIETHSANFRDSDHLCADVSNYDMRRLPRTAILWASPICTEISPAGGNKRTRGQQELELFGPVAKAGLDRTRATFHDVIRATEVHRYRAVLVENVVEAASWELFDWWVTGMTTLGYNVQFVSVSSAHVGDEVNPHAPQWRDRLYMVFTRKGIPLPDVTPRPLAYCESCDEVVRSEQWWKKEGRKIGKYGSQYAYVCPKPSHRGSRMVEPFILPAAAAIDWSDLGTRIGDRPRPLAAATLRRIEAGLKMFAQPVVAQAAGQTYERPGSGYYRVWPAGESPTMARTGTGADGIATTGEFTVPTGGTWRKAPQSLEDPMGARTTRDTDGMVVPPFSVHLTHGKDDSGRHHALDSWPLATRSTKTGDGVVIPPGAFISKAYTPRGQDSQMVKDPKQEPLGAVTGSDHHQLVVPPMGVTLRSHSEAWPIGESPTSSVNTARHDAMVVPPGAFIQKHHGGLDYKAIEHMVKGVGEPMPGVVAKANLSLVIPYRRGQHPRPAGATALPTVATRETTGLLEAEIEVDDCRFRMLKPREHLAAQRFPHWYVVTGNQGEQTMQAGNAVSANVAHWLARQVAAVL